MNNLGSYLGILGGVFFITMLLIYITLGRGPDTNG